MNEETLNRIISNIEHIAEKLSNKGILYDEQSFISAIRIYKIYNSEEKKRTKGINYHVEPDLFDDCGDK